MIKNNFLSTTLNITLSILLAAFLLPQFAMAEIYKHVGPDGRITYSNVKLKGAKKLDLEPADTSFGNSNSAGDGQNASAPKRVPATRTATPANFPKVDAGTQNQRDGKRKDILLGELNAEKKALDDAKIALNEGAEKPEVYRNQQGQIRRNVPKFDAKMKSLQDNVDVHQRNIELLEKEISNIN